MFFFFFSSRRRHTRFDCDWSSDVCSSDLRVQETAQRLGLTELLDRRPAQLSGGQRRRVALGRAIVRAPRVFLFDEPLSNLDAGLRGELRAELLALHRALGATLGYVTPDPGRK